jgi:hypothetical protein
VISTRISKKGGEGSDGCEEVDDDGCQVPAASPRSGQADVNASSPQDRRLRSPALAPRLHD